MIVDETRLEAFAQFGLGKPRDHNGGGAEHLISITKRVCITIIVIITVVSSRHWCLMASRADDPSSRCTSSDGIRYGLGKPRNDEGGGRMSVHRPGLRGERTALRRERVRREERDDKHRARCVAGEQRSAERAVRDRTEERGRQRRVQRSSDNPAAHTDTNLHLFCKRFA